jgi:LysM repeat protein
MRFRAFASMSVVALLLLVVAAPASADTYQVRPGDTLSAIARQHGLTVAELQAANSLADANRLYVGRSLVIPPTTHVVRAGEALSVIARDHGMSVEALAVANGITDPNQVRAGQVLRLRPGSATPAPAPSRPAPTPAPAPAPATSTHVVQPGEVLSVLARRLSTTTADLLRLNALPDPNHIRSGQVLVIPAGGPASPAPAPTPAPPNPAPAPIATSAPGAARYPSLPGRLPSLPDRLALIPSFERWAAHYGLPIELLMAVAWRESGWQTGAVSSAGALGVGQLMPSTATWVAATIIGNPALDPRNPDDNIRMSAAYLRWLHTQMGGRDLAIAAYFQGPTSVRRLGLLPVTESYVQGVNSLVARFRPA